MSILTYLIDNRISDAKEEYDAKTLTSPVLSMADGTNKTYCVDVDIGSNTYLRNTPIASGNRELIYADVGSAVRVRKSPSGRYEVVGFSKRMPGTYYATPITVIKRPFRPMLLYTGPVPDDTTGSMVVGEPARKGVTSKVLTYGELQDMGGYGRVPYGAVAIFEDGILKEIK